MTTYTSAQVAKFIGRTTPSIRRYTHDFQKFLSESAQPVVDDEGKAVEREYTARDVKVLHWIVGRYEAKLRTPEITALLEAFGADGPPDMTPFERIEREAEREELLEAAIVDATISDKYMSSITDAVTGTRAAMQAMQANLTITKDVSSIQADISAIMARLDVLEARLNRLEDDLKSRRLFIRL